MSLLELGPAFDPEEDGPMGSPARVYKLRPATQRLHESEIDRSTSVRHRLNRTQVIAYAELIALGHDLGNPIVFFDGAAYWIGDGAHRIAAQLRTGNAEILCEVREGSAAEAFRCGIEANRAHGLPLAPKDRKRIVRMWFATEGDTGESSRALADLLGCSHTTINRLRREAKTVEQSSKPEGSTVYMSCRRGRNSEQLAEILQLHAFDGAMIADVTAGEMSFWRAIPRSRYQVLPSDIEPRIAGVSKADLRALPYQEASLDVVVMDPPYHKSGGTSWDLSERYRDATDINSVLALYRDGAQEAMRVLKPKGLLVVKCQDATTAGGAPVWSHMRITQDAEAMGYKLADLYILMSEGNGSMPLTKGSKQRMARRNHSVWLVLRKPGKAGRPRIGERGGPP